MYHVPGTVLSRRATFYTQYVSATYYAIILKSDKFEEKNIELNKRYQELDFLCHCEYRNGHICRVFFQVLPIIYKIFRIFFDCSNSVMVDCGIKKGMFIGYINNYVVIMTHFRLIF